jgi:hypothetical protein
MRRFSRKPPGAAGGRTGASIAASARQEDAMNDAQRNDSSTIVTSDQPAPGEPRRTPMRPGDEAPEGTPGTGPNVCPTCGGSGRLAGGPCTNCLGTGQVTTGIGGA